MGLDIWKLKVDLIFFFHLQLLNHTHPTTQAFVIVIVWLGFFLRQSHSVVHTGVQCPDLSSLQPPPPGLK